MVFMSYVNVEVNFYAIVEGFLGWFVCVMTHVL